ncbi:tetratricopeptide repeat-containing sensor histidine kinase [Flavobacterium litorale]|uniref:Tetratricopeptide repeat protein n=1 Tax=Flavobacterium litorale TaxID=2856519 RepID=A0ABX8VCY0_9FLAO|nr:tetratricopeptide repeat-containing sensor histidine kinase [Flavobacterium litorale]QYJ68529.1 tetratricopeptide repeat protein [Flavobacterium litorale]
MVILLYATSCSSPEDKVLSQTKAGKYLDESNNTGLEVGERRKYVDSAYMELKSNKQNDSVTRYLYSRTIAAYYNLDLYDKSLVVSNDALEMATEVEDTLDIAKTLYRIGDIYYAKSNNDTAFYYYDKAEKLYLDLDEPGGLGEIILYKAYIYYNIGEYVLSEVQAFKALELLQKDNRTVHIYNCYNLIASALDGQNNTKEALAYYNDAFQYLDNFRNEGYSEANIEIYKASCYNNIGGVYIKQGDYQKAIDIYNEALQINDLKNRATYLYAKLLNNLAYAKFKAGDDKDLPDLFYESLNIRDSINNTSGIVASSIHLGEYFASEQDTVQALKYLKNAYSNAKKIKSHFDILNSLKLLAELDKDRSIYYSNRYITVNDSLQDMARANREKYARIEYETNKLQSEKEALVKRNSLIIGASAIALLFIAAVFIIYYLNSRNKELLLIQEQQKANEEIYQLMNEQQTKIDLARKEEKDRIAMELHDGILNNIYAVRLNLEFINKKADEEAILKRKGFIKDLQKVETEIRAVSHDLSKNAMLQQEKSFENILQYMIASQKNDFNTVFESDIDSTVNWDVLSNILKVNIYRIVQEALQNINKYSQANFAKVTIEKESDSISVTILDDGIGFDTQTSKGGIGLKNLNKRALALSGNIEITSQVGNGSIIKVTFPI